MKLGTRLSILILLAALPVLAIQVFDLLGQREDRKAQIAEQALQLARLSAARHDQFIEGARYLLTAAAELREVQERDVQACSAKMAEFLRRLPAVTGIGAVGPDGVQFCTSAAPSPGLSIADRDYFQDAVRTRALSISGFIISRRTGRPNLNFAYPAIDDDGEVRAVVVLAFELEQLSQILTETALPPGGTVSLIDDHGLLLARAPPGWAWIGQRIGETAFVETIVSRREGTTEGVGFDDVERIYGFAPLFGSADLFAVVGLPWRDAFAAADRLFWLEVAFTVLTFMLAALVALLAAERWIRRPVGAVQAAVRRVGAGDLAARAGEIRGASPELRELGANFDRMAELLERRQNELRAGEERLRAVVETAADGIITIDGQGMVHFANAAAERLFGFDRASLIGRRGEDLLPGAFCPGDLEGSGRSTVAAREAVGVRRNGDTFPVSLSIGAFSLGEARFATLIMRDITERKRLEQHQRLLMGEIDHRSKNLLAAVQSMALLARQHGGTAEEFATTFVARIRSLARAHELLASERWEGAPLHGLIRAQLSPFVAPDDAALTIKGEDVVLNSSLVQPLSLALHELTTNAAKYGALSRPGGTLEVISTVRRSDDGPELLLDWIESGGPEVREPERRGFGRTLIEQGIAYELDGRADFEFAPSGLRCRLTLPLRARQKATAPA